VIAAQVTDAVFISGDGDEPEEGVEGGPRDRRSWLEVMHPEGAEGTWRDLPALLADSFRLVWQAGRREFRLTAALQLVTAVGIAAQLFVAKELLAAVLAAGDSGSFQDVLPELLAVVAITVALDFAGAVEAEQSRVLSELVSRRALDRVLDVATRVDLLAFESPDFNDRLRRAQAQGFFRALQTVNGLLGLVGGAVAGVGIVAALATLQPLLLPLVALGYVPLWIVASRNSRDFYSFAYGMTANERERHYLLDVLLGRDPAKEVRAFQLAPFLRRRKAGCSSGCASCSRAGRSCSSRTASRASAPPTGSTSSTAAAWSSTARTTS
jgi:ATP-binding cassette subfamily B protein